MGFVGMIWWVLVVLGDSFDGVEIGVVGFGCYNGGAVTCHGGAVTCCHDPNPLKMNLDT